MRVEEGLREVLGDGYAGDYTFINYTMTKKGLAAFINKLVALYGANKVARILDVFKEVGFHFATRAAVTVSKNDVVVPAKEKAEILGTHEAMVDQLRDEYNNGFLSEEERRGKVQEIWREADVQITAATRANFNPLNPIYMMATSGARGDIKQIRQLAGWRGQMANPKGEIVEQPVKSSFIEGLSVLEFFISTHGARKGLADTALRTADSGYLTRRLVDVCQDVTVSDIDCGTKEWVPMSPWSRRREENPELEGTTLAEDVRRPRSDRVVLKKGEKIGPAQIGLLREVYSTLPNAKVKVKKGKAAGGASWPCGRTNPTRTSSAGTSATPSSRRRPARSCSSATRTSTSRPATRSSTSSRAARRPTRWCRSAACSSATPRSACARSATATRSPTTRPPRSATPSATSRRSPSASRARSSPCARSTPAASPAPTSPTASRASSSSSRRASRRASRASPR